jgi:nicotinate-nucleotide adenylyltransferase
LICLFGGTFDPIHLGHLHAARSVCEALALDRINLLLSARPGHRGAPGASIEHRWRMLELACADDARLVPDDREILRARRLARPSWTVETLEELRAEQGAHGALLWVIGSDGFRDLPTWHRWERILELSHLVLLRRPGAPLLLGAPMAEVLRTRRTAGLPEGAAGRIVVLDLPMLPISATAVRAALAAGQPTGDLLPPAVCTYISRHQLYGVRSDPGSTA